MSALAILYGYIYTCQYQYTPPWSVNRKVQIETTRLNTLKQHTIQYEAYKKRIAVIKRLSSPEEADKFIEIENDWFKKKYLNPIKTTDKLTKNNTVLKTQIKRVKNQSIALLLDVLKILGMIANIYTIVFLIALNNTINYR
tara:strand:- start:125 stop:547 length:423 start_codon:yes stop_codon:yes gene_type:complete